jgi:hypothetical protein
LLTLLDYLEKIPHVCVSAVTWEERIEFEELEHNEAATRNNSEKARKGIETLQDTGLGEETWPFGHVYNMESLTLFNLPSSSITT